MITLSSYKQQQDKQIKVFDKLAICLPPSIIANEYLAVVVFKSSHLERLQRPTLS